MRAFPTLQDLAVAPEDQLLKVWQGLGYYSRARNLQKAAVQIVEEFQGVFPQAYEEIRTLPGIGDYTASAITSISFGLPYAAVDGNLLRVAARIAGDFDDITTLAMKKKVTTALQGVIPLYAAGAFNQAMMDLGAMVCLPNGVPLCDRCPAVSFCLAYRKKQTELLPVRTKKKARRREERDVFLILSDRKVALRRRPSKGLLAGLWEFPSELASEGEIPPDYFGLAPYELSFAGTGKHIFTHVEWHMRAFFLLPENPKLPEGWAWVDKEALQQEYPVPNAYACFFEILEAYL
jgi:A/G-specific adenine glycosylase